ncbi:hypothetical protein [Streptomyces sp. B3I8]|nr:hypothetical protein [Streptomyces sp. B3I8]
MSVWTVPNLLLLVLRITAPFFVPRRTSFRRCSVRSGVRRATRVGKSAYGVKRAIVTTSLSR